MCHDTTAWSGEGSAVKSGSSTCKMKHFNMQIYQRLASRTPYDVCHPNVCWLDKEIKRKQEKTMTFNAPLLSNATKPPARGGSVFVPQSEPKQKSIFPFISFVTLNFSSLSEEMTTARLRPHMQVTLLYRRFRVSRVVGEAQRPGGCFLSGDLKPSVSHENQIWEAQVVTHFLAGI